MFVRCLWPVSYMNDADMETLTDPFQFQQIIPVIVIIFLASNYLNSYPMFVLIIIK